MFVIATPTHSLTPFFDITECPEHFADLWLESVAKGTMHMFTEEVLKIHELTAHATKQLVTDIGKLHPNTLTYSYIIYR